MSEEIGVNDYQVGGDHYKSRKYQHWDFVCDTNLHYLLACATKYISRWRDKNGIEDLRKPIHYLQKAACEKIFAPDDITTYTHRFIDDMEDADAIIITAIVTNRFDYALQLIDELIKQEIE